MKPRLKKTCNRCKALHLSKGYGYSCSFGHRMDIKNAIPKEPCEKPMTNADYVYLSRWAKPTNLKIGGYQDE